ncbi:uncharacterized protein LOC131955171 [Physella acuta]|uniref:uncharacterized protein LOC131955171 n=1 Tax=Physella acuta TaxID=109671 RepID=UPI0027DB4474|nr:uncharacterized protein LOC131955171 [Physella acuta]
MSVKFRIPSPEKMNDEGPNLKDNSRPMFARPSCSIGLYIDALDARPNSKTTVGSNHAFMMDVMDKMLDHLRTVDLAKVKGALDAKRVADGVVLEGFKHGCVLSVTFDTVKALEGLWTLHQKGKLSPIFQEILVDKEVLKSTSTVKLTVRVRLWEDEFTACRIELTNRPQTRLKLANFENDLSMVQRLKTQQQTMPDLLTKARDFESSFEHNLGEFMLTVKKTLPQTTTVIRNIKEFSTHVKVAKGVKTAGFENIDHFLKAVEFYSKAFSEVQKNIVFPLCQVRAACENDKQHNLKKTIKDACAEMMAHLKPEADLEKVRYKEWEMKVLKREQGLFYGLISLIPLCLDRLITIDVSMDEYITDYAEMAQ